MSDAREMMTEIRAAKILGSVRGMARVDQALLARAIVAVSGAAAENPDIAEIDIKSLIVAGSRPIAVDGLSYSQACEGASNGQKRPQTLFAPRSVAVISASATEGRPGRVVIENMRANSYKGDIHPVNLRGGKLFGLQGFKTIKDLPSGIDLADCNPAGAGNAAGGARLRGAEYRLDRHWSLVASPRSIMLVKICSKNWHAPLRRPGACPRPQYGSHISTPADFTSSFFPLGEIPRGGISYVAQTGNFTGAMMKHIMSAENYGVARYALGLGNTVDIDRNDVFNFATDRHTGDFSIWKTFVAPVNSLKSLNR